jgi:hypothetical protein
MSKMYQKVHQQVHQEVHQEMHQDGKYFTKEMVDFITANIPATQLSRKDIMLKGSVYSRVLPVLEDLLEQDPTLCSGSEFCSSSDEGKQDNQWARNMAVCLGDNAAELLSEVEGRRRFLCEEIELLREVVGCRVGDMVHVPKELEGATPEGRMLWMLEIAQAPSSMREWVEKIGGAKMMEMFGCPCALEWDCNNKEYLMRMQVVNNDLEVAEQDARSMSTLFGTMQQRVACICGSYYAAMSGLVRTLFLASHPLIGKNEIEEEAFDMGNVQVEKRQKMMEDLANVFAKLWEVYLEKKYARRMSKKRMGRYFY